MALRRTQRRRLGLDAEWDITTRDLVTFRAVARGANPLIAQEHLIARSWSEDDSYDFVNLALAEEPK